MPKNALKRDMNAKTSRANLPQFLVKTEGCWSVCNRTYSVDH